MRKYIKTHPWLSFELHLEEAPWQMWLLLGECRSKCAHLAGVPLRPEIARDFYSVYLAKGAHGSAAIEGNTLSEEEVRRQVDGSLDVPKSREYLRHEVDNIIKACNEIGRRIYVDGATALTPERIVEYNKRVLDGMELEKGMEAGVIPEKTIGVGRYPGAPREDCEYLIEKLCDWIGETLDNQTPEPLGSGLAILHAIVAHVYFEWIHPYPDGNGRTGRLIEFHILNASGVPAPASHLLSNFYNQTRDRYYKELQKASEHGGDLRSFLCYALEGFRDGLKEQIDRIREEHLTSAWINYVHQQFAGIDKTPSQRRRRRIALALGDRLEAVPLSEVKLLTPEIALAYGDRTIKTVKRDLNALEEMKLLIRIGTTYKANAAIVKAWMPRRVDVDLPVVQS